MFCDDRLDQGRGCVWLESISTAIVNPRAMGNSRDLLSYHCIAHHNRFHGPHWVNGKAGLYIRYEKEKTELFSTDMENPKSGAAEREMEFL